ncbi:GIY-YIG nuclease family protein [Roseivirga pacifica]|uniref:GIY-YIG nuclease family protein n=1 Tax=Roseivirga pacifica TaxID=1267423 RepID=UPI003BAECF5C
MHAVYIIFSPSQNRFYVGESVNAEARLDQNNLGYYENSFTKVTDDWVLKLVLKCNDKTHAKRIESHIKSMKSKRYIENLLAYDEMRQKLLNRYS